MGKESKEQVTVNLEPDFYEFAKLIASRQGLPLSVYCRKLIHKAILLDVGDHTSWKYFKNSEEERESF
ncbi:MAG: hypothetical protein ACOCQT_00195 [Desulfovermiculus sp.]